LVLHLKSNRAIAACEGRYLHEVTAQVDDGRLGGEHLGLKSGGDSENGVPPVAAVSQVGKDRPRIPALQMISG
jgi:hypothetical protein